MLDIGPSESGLQREPFEAWLKALDGVAQDRGYGGSITYDNAECWKEFYDDGLTPADALDEDESNA